jgi:hypothetical protein
VQIKLMPTNKILKAAILGLFAAVGVALTYYDVRGKIAAPWSNLLTIGYLVLVGILVRFGNSALPPEYRIPFFSTRPNLSDIIKGVACFVLALVWTAIAVRLANDTLVGAVLVFAPPLVLILAMAFFLGRAFYWFRGQK